MFSAQMPATASKTSDMQICMISVTSLVGMANKPMAISNSRNGFQ